IFMFIPFALRLQSDTKCFPRTRAHAVRVQPAVTLASVAAAALRGDVIAGNRLQADAVSVVDRTAAADLVDGERLPHISQGPIGDDRTLATAACASATVLRGEEASVERLQVHLIAVFEIPAIDIDQCQ